MCVPGYISDELYLLIFAIEPTSALDAATSDTVEKYILDEIKSRHGKLKAVVWITHSVEQAKRVGTRFLRITAGGIHEESSVQDV